MEAEEFQEGETAVLLYNITSVIKRDVLFGKKGDIVKIICIKSYPVLIVENAKGGFPIRAEKLYKTQTS